MYLVNVRLDTVDSVPPPSLPETRSLLWAAVRPGDGVEHIYAQPYGRSVEAVLFVERPTLAEAERCCDTVLDRCAADGPRFSRRSSVPLPLLVELLGDRSEH
ncbi:hypothetical protein BU52_32050 [Streptomyces toyocaensis]|uniref:Uncharacterized protein n=1 Tax=Streptomyces toyocaensis TaxID=55952 RepID=A0A081XHY7_STRTO|nr:hypothetical protein [Streptomyces toyocaensis]KES03160.1 hypothetical protein BU52_32050 [Streptomyces toyocaensis]